MPELDESRFFEPAGRVTAEEKIKRSLFIAALSPCHTSDDVRTFLAEVEAAHKTATHNCWAYILGPTPLYEHSSDNGEPSGTAGKPILAAIKKSGMVNLMIVVTRYFGGVKLGVRGLIEAYGSVAGLAVAQSEKVLRILSKRLVISLPYDIIGEVARILDSNMELGSPEWKYGETVEISADIPLSNTSRVTETLDELQARQKLHSWSWVT